MPLFPVVTMPTVTSLGRAPAPVVHSIGRAPASIPVVQVMQSIAPKVPVPTPSVLIAQKNAALASNSMIAASVAKAVGNLGPLVNASGGPAVPSSVPSNPIINAASTGLTSSSLSSNSTQLMQNAASGGGGMAPVPIALNAPAPDAPYIPPPTVDDPSGAFTQYMTANPAISTPTTNSALQGLITSGPATAMSATAPAAIAAANANAAVPKQSLFERFLAWLGLVKKSAAIAAVAKMNGEAGNMVTLSRTEAAYSLINRARYGDQNAMAMIASVRDQALAGNNQAKISLNLMKKYIDQNPTTEMGEDEIPQDNSVIQAAVQMANGPQIQNSKIAAVTMQMKPIERAAFFHGMKGGNCAAKMPERIQNIHKLGKVTAAAQAIQAARNPKVPVQKIDAGIGWEIGGEYDDTSGSRYSTG